MRLQMMIRPEPIVTLVIIVLTPTSGANIKQFTFVLFGGSRRAFFLIDDNTTTRLLNKLNGRR